ncbi:MAG: hypothetical protein L3J57_07980 [Desulfuromusa sp.]|nr:hypothetical protein [Desulfuromusa sp.]
MFKNVALTYLFRQVFRMFVVGALLAVQLQALPLSSDYPVVSEITHLGTQSLPLECFVSVVDVEDCHDSLLFIEPSLPRLNPTGLPLLQFSTWLLSSTAGVMFTHFARPPPVS